MKTIFLFSFVCLNFLFLNSAHSQEWLYNKNTKIESGSHNQYQPSNCNCNCNNCSNCNFSHNNHYTISDFEFNKLTTFISKRPFSDSRISIMKEAIDYNYFKVTQIKDLFSYLSFESDKIEIAKYAYKKIIDKQNFYYLYDLLTFESSVNELMEFVRNQRN
ncbi:MAG TPA: DUF4476 domain-containing protein [Ignavibacteria bacterium]|nr:DUF4476 domain-containing protein [Ignavibacteria bacterium]